MRQFKELNEGVWVELRDGLGGLIERLHFGGTQRDKAGNRELHMEQYCSLLLLWFLAPVSTASAGG